MPTSMDIFPQLTRGFVVSAELDVILKSGIGIFQSRKVHVRSTKNILLAMKRDGKVLILGRHQEPIYIE
jgi:hypothetical protein